MSMIKSKKIELSEPPTSKMQFSDRLADGLDFDRKDLELNRCGHMTDKQIDLKLQKFSSTRATDSILLVIALFSGLLVAGMMMNNGGVSIFIGIGVAIAILIYVVSGIRRTNTIKRELEMGIVDYSMGRVIITSVDRAPVISLGDNVYNSNLGMMHHRYTKVAGAFTNEEFYILYHLPESNLIISAEPLESQ